jgi:hypothetical protein
MRAFAYNLKGVCRPQSRFLLVRSCHVGDFLVCVPFLRALTEGLGIDSKNIDFLILNNRRFDPVQMLFGKERFGRVHVASTADFRGFFQDSIKLRKELDLNGRQILYLPFWRNSSLELMVKRLLLIMPLGARSIEGMGDVDAAIGTLGSSQYFCLQKLYGLPVQENQRCDQRPYLGLTSKECMKVGAYLKSKKIRNFSVFYPHSKLGMKVWPLENYKEVARARLKKGAIVAVGGLEDKEYNDAFAQGLGSRVFNAAGFFSIRENIELMGRSELFVGNDGAPMHMAALSGVRVVAPFTYKEPVGAWEPMGTSRMVTVRRDIACRECYRSECPYGSAPCLATVGVKEIMEAIKRIETHRGPYSQARILPMASRV